MLCILRSMVKLTSALVFVLCLFSSNVFSNVTQDTLVIGSISSKPSKSFERLTPLSKYLQEKLAPFGIAHVKIKVAKNRDQMQQLIDAEQVDILSETMVTAVQLKHVDVDLLSWKQGLAQYRSLLITQKDSDIQTISDLIGKTIAFEDTGSTSSYLIPMLAITEVTDQIKLKANIQQVNDPQKINYIFSAEAYATSQDNISIWTHRSIVHAAAISDLDWDNDRKFPEHIKRDLRVFYQSAEIPRSLVMVRSTLAPQLKQALTNILLNIHLDPKAQPALLKFRETKMFTPLTADEKQNIEIAREGYNQRIKVFE